MASRPMQTVGVLMTVVRPATPEDLPALRKLIPLSVRGLSQADYSPAQIESAIHHVFGTDTRLIADGTYFVAVEADRIVGCGGWSFRRTLYGGDQAKAREDTRLDPQAEAARIRAFFVHPDWARPTRADDASGVKPFTLCHAFRPASKRL